MIEKNRFVRTMTTKNSEILAKLFKNVKVLSDFKI